jgi:two-component sensor histidine kinase
MDTRTISILFQVTSIQCCILFFIAGTMHRKAAAWSYPPSYFWGFGTLIQSIGYLALATQERSSPWIGIVLANSLMLLGQVFILVGLRRLLGREHRISRYLALWGAATCLIAVFAFLAPSLVARVVFASCIVSLLYIDGGIQCLRARIAGLLAPAMGLVFLALAAFFAARACITLAAPQGPILASTRLNVATAVVAELGLIAWSLGLLLLQTRIMELDLERASEEKEVLVHELQHRVKNSISVIASLVGLEAARSADSPTRGILEGLQGRIAAIGALYDKLYRSGETREVELDDYLRFLAETLFFGQAAEDRGIALELELERVRIDMGRAAPLGLIANELLADCLKHAFPDGRRGTVRLELRREGEELVLEVGDDGVGLPGGVARGERCGRGLVIVDLLARQLRGSFWAGSENGALFRLRFPLLGEDRAPRPGPRRRGSRQSGAGGSRSPCSTKL